MPQCSRPSKGVAARTLGLANHGRRSICCPIRASGTSGTNEQQLNSDLSHLASPAALFHSFSSLSIYCFISLSLASMSCLSLWRCCTPVHVHLHTVVIADIPLLCLSCHLYPECRRVGRDTSEISIQITHSLTCAQHLQFMCVCSEGGHLSTYGVGKFNTVCFLAGVTAAL